MSLRNDVADTVTSMLHAVDALDWAAGRAAFADLVATDYTSLFGGQAETLAADELVTRWQGLLPGFDATQHLTGPVLVTDAAEREAACQPTVRAYHHVVGDGRAGTWVVAGRYRIRLRQEAGGWKITALTLDTLYEEGDRGLVDVATGRIAAGSGGRLRPTGAAR